jgi:hypothetical protein
MSEWHYTQNGQPAGAPISTAELKQLAATGKLKPTDMVWRDGMPNWVQAGTLPEIFAAPAAPAPAPRAPAPMPGPGPAGPMAGAPMDVGYAPPPPPGAGSALIDPAVDVKRAYSWDLHDLPVSEAEKNALAPAGVTGELGQRYLAWRRSLLWLAAVPAVFAFLFGAINEIIWMTGNQGGGLKLGILGILVHLARMFVLLLLPAGAVLGALTWAKPSLSRLAVLGGAVLPLLAHLVLGLVPFSSMLPEDVGKGHGLESLFGGAWFIVSLPAWLPFILGVAPGTMRAAINVKTLAPESPLPGWALLGLAIPYSLAMLVFAVPALFQLNLVAGLAALLFFVAPLLYVVKAKAFLRTGATAEDRKGMVLFQWIYLAVSGLGVFTLFIADLAVGDARPASPLMLAEYGLEYIAVSLLTTAVMTDLMLGFLASSWREQQQFAKSPEAAAFDQRIAGLEGAIPKL